jgi:hypothetical protein
MKAYWTKKNERSYDRARRAREERVMKKLFVLIAAIVAVVGFGVVGAAAKKGIEVKTSVTLGIRSDLSGPRPDSFIGEVRARKAVCQKGRTVTVNDGFTKVGSDKSNDRGRYKIFHSLAGSGGRTFFARARKAKITKDNGDKIVCERSKQVRFRCCPKGDGEPIDPRDGSCARPSGQPCSIGRYKQYDLTGPVAAGGTVSFQVLVSRSSRKADWVPKKVTNLELDGFLVTCDDGPHTIDVSGGAVRVRVKHRDFSFQFPSVTASVEGKLRKHGERATGQFSYGPSDPSGLTNCASDGPLSWSVELKNTTPCNRNWRTCF